MPGIRCGSWKLILEADKQSKAKVQLYNLADDIGETKNLTVGLPDRVEQMTALLEKPITDGRSTPGVAQKNDVEVRRYPQRPAVTKKNAQARK